MRWSELFIPTLPESPADAASLSLQWLVRAGFLRAVFTGVSTGVYGYLPLGVRSLSKIQSVAREELLAIGGQEVNLAPPAAAQIARGELRSPKQLPQIWFRVESPLLSASQFAGLDVYGFGECDARVRTAFARILERCALPAVAVEDGLCVPVPGGPDAIVICPACGYTASSRTAASVPAGDSCTHCGAASEIRGAVDLARWRGGVYQLALDRILTTSIGLRHDKDGMILPAAIAPFDVVVTAAAIGEPAERIYRECLEAGLDTLLDDREEPAGVKFKDSDLIGVPWRITVGKKLTGGLLELTERRTRQTGDVPLEGAQAWLARLREVL